MIANADDYLEFLFGRRADLGEIKTLLTKYGDNPKMYKQLFSLKYQNRKLLHPKDWFKLDKSKLLLDIDVMHLQKLKDLDKIISTVGTTEKQRFWTILLKNTKNLDNVEALMKTQALQYTDDVMKQLSSIRSVVASTSVQNVSTLSKSYERLYQLGDGVDDITRKILHQRNIADNANYFVNTQKIAEAKAMAQEMIKTNPIATAKNL
ncbi:MAG: hypothetical protein LBP53_03160 [Candidatus Peribacteria bacterium]|nr:hypothetical protein [Candidatus Peribacteria bacterium]